VQGGSTHATTSEVTAPRSRTITSTAVSTVVSTAAAALDEVGEDSCAATAVKDWWQHSPCPQLVLDPEAATVLSANETFWAWTGLVPNTVIGTSFARLLPVGDRILWNTHCLPKLESSGRVSEVSVQVTGAGGARRAAFLTASRLPATEVRGASHSGRVLVALFGAAERRLYEEDLLQSKRRAEASEARRARAEEGLHHLAHHDPVTGLLNSRGLQAALASLLFADTAAGQGPGLPAEPSPAALPKLPPEIPPGSQPKPGSVMVTEVVEDGTDRVAPTATPTGYPTVFFVDLDGFKAVNDSVGHAGGDTLLRTVAERLRATLRTETVLARFAGDEFVIADLVATAADVDVICRRLLDALAEPVLISGVEVVVTASIGVALCADDPGVHLQDGPARAEALLHRADAAMYQVKHGAGRAGTGGWAVHDPSAADPAADRLRLLEQLRHAINDGQLRLHYQPRIDLADAVVGGVEALVRWSHPERGLLSPAHFIDAAETSGLIRELGAWVIGEAVAQAARWNAQGRRLQVGVNVSARQLSDPTLVSVVTAALARHGVAASQLVVEITETALMLDPEAAAGNLRQLADLGAQIAVDDFGTGYASLTYLKQFPVHELKIDQSFVAGIAEDPADRAIVAGCIQLAHALGLTSVAEGVETAAQRDVLKELGCQVAQGYLFGRPQPSEALTS